MLLFMGYDSRKSLVPYNHKECDPKPLHNDVDYNASGEVVVGDHMI
jgi:hypothetical protein